MKFGWRRSPPYTRSTGGKGTCCYLLGRSNLPNPAICDARSKNKTKKTKKKKSPSSAVLRFNKCTKGHALDNSQTISSPFCLVADISHLVANTNINVTRPLSDDDPNPAQPPTPTPLDPSTHPRTPFNASDLRNPSVAFIHSSRRTALPAGKGPPRNGSSGRAIIRAPSRARPIMEFEQAGQRFRCSST